MSIRNKASKMPLWAKAGLVVSTFAMATTGCAAERPLSAEQRIAGTHTVLDIFGTLNGLPPDCSHSVILGLGTLGCEHIPAGQLEIAQQGRQKLSKLVGESRVETTAVAAGDAQSVSAVCVDALLRDTESEKLNSACMDEPPSELQLASNGLDGIGVALDHEKRDNIQWQYNKNAAAWAGVTLVLGLAGCVVGALVQLDSEG